MQIYRQNSAARVLGAASRCVTQIKQESNNADDAVRRCSWCQILEELQTQRLTDRNPGGQSDPVALSVGADQLLPHEEDRCDIQGICHKLVNDHKDDGHIPSCIHRYHTIHITCKGNSSTSETVGSNQVPQRHESQHGQ